MPDPGRLVGAVAGVAKRHYALSVSLRCRVTDRRCVPDEDVLCGADGWVANLVGQLGRRHHMNEPRLKVMAATSVGYSVRDGLLS